MGDLNNLNEGELHTSLTERALIGERVLFALVFKLPSRIIGG